MEKNQNGDVENIEERQHCEVYSRVVGYLRPVKQWNKGKQEEFGERKTYEVDQGCCS